MMTDLEKERALHKVVVSSAFLLSLCILPIAQYFLGSASVAPSSITTQTTGTDQGRVAGVSTQKTITQADVPILTSDTNTICLTKKQADLAGLQLFDDGKKAALLRDYEKKTASYQQALLVVTGTPDQVKAAKEALTQSIDQEYQPYLKKLSAVEAAVESQKKAVESRSCPSL